MISLPAVNRRAWAAIISISRPGTLLSLPPPARGEKNIVDAAATMAPAVVAVAAPATPTTPRQRADEIQPENSAVAVITALATPGRAAGARTATAAICIIPGARFSNITPGFNIRTETAFTISWV